MTASEAIKTLFDQPYIVDKEKYTEAKAMAIAALEQQISLETAMQKLKSMSFERYGNHGMGGQMVVALDDVIEVLGSNMQ